MSGPDVDLLSVPLSVIPNCQFRSKTSRLKTFTANQLDEIKDPSGLFYILPFQKVKSRKGEAASAWRQTVLFPPFLFVSSGLPGELGRPEEGVGPPVWKGDV